MEFKRKIIFHGGHFMKFYEDQPAKIQDKIDFVFNIINTVEKVPEKFLKHLTGTDALYEIRVKYGRTIFRIFCCFDKGNLIVLFNALQKKTQQTPKQEIYIAERMKREYFQLKKYES